GQGELEVAGDEDRRQLGAAGGGAPVDDADRLDRRHLLGLERRQQAVLARGEPLRQLLQREEASAELDEAHDVATDAALGVDELLRRPFLERQAPREGEERALLGAREETERRGRHLSGGSDDGP